MVNDNFNFSDSDLMNMSDSFFASHLKPISNMCIEMEALYDYRLTALAALTENQTELNYIHSRLKTYAKFKGRQITTCFPSLKKTEADIDNFLSDPKHVAYLSEHALITNFVNLVPAKLIFINQFNRNTPLYEGEPLNVTITNPFFLPTRSVMEKIGHNLKKMYPNMVISFSKKSLPDDNPAFLKSQDILIIDDMEAFTREGSSTYKILLEEKGFLGSMISAAYKLEETAPWMDDEGEERVRALEKQLSVFAAIQFIDKQLI